MNAFLRDVRHAVRGFRKNPGFAAIVLFTLGLGIGANAAIFSLMDQVLVRSLPVQDPSRLVLLDGPGAFQGRTFGAMTFSYPMYTDLRDRHEVLSGAPTECTTNPRQGYGGPPELRQLVTEATVLSVCGGATRVHLMRLVLLKALGLAVAGVALGTLAATQLARRLTGMLFGVEPLDPWTTRPPHRCSSLSHSPPLPSPPCARRASTVRRR